MEEGNINFAWEHKFKSGLIEFGFMAPMLSTISCMDLAMNLV